MRRGTFELYVGGNAQTNLALAGTAIQSSEAHGGQPGRGIDGNTNGTWSNGSCTHTADQPNSWWEVQLTTSAPISRILLYNRLDCCHKRLSNFRVSVFDGSAEVHSTPPSSKANGGAAGSSTNPPATVRSSSDAAIARGEWIVSWERSIVWKEGVL